MSELKPCPKCNGEASIEYENYDFDGGDWWLIREADVVCLECGLVFHAENESREYQQGEHCLDFIIEAWNTRAPMSYEDLKILLDELGVSERTCDITILRAYDGEEVARYCGCGCLLEAEDNYCPNCGAKVVSE